MPRSAGEVRRPEIVSAFFRAIKKQGGSLPGYDAIAERDEGLSRQLIRHYFKDPEDLAVALCDALAHSYRECLMKGIIKANTPTRLPVFLDFYFDFLTENGLPKPADDAVYDALFAYATKSERVRQNLHDQYELLQMTVSHEIQITYPELPQSGCRELGFLLVSLMYGHWKMVATLGFSREHNRVSRQAMDRLIASYRANYEDPDDTESP